MKTIAMLSEEFRRFAADCTGTSPLYEVLANHLAEEKEILSFCQHIDRNQPAPNILFGAVHYLLLNGPKHQLADFYPSISENPEDRKQAFPAFADFCRQYEEDLIPLMRHKLVQTNEIRRCAYLYPVFCLIYEKVRRPVSIIEVGTSAGLQLLWDLYGYQYGTDKIYGNDHADIVLPSIYKGKKPPLHQQSPPVARKIGIDLHPNDMREKEDYLWLQALIWPEHAKRRQRLKSVAAVFKKHPVELVKGNAIDLLPKLVETLEDKGPVCIFHTHVANQLTTDDKQALLQQVEQLGAGREIFHIYNNIWDRQLHLDYIYQDVRKPYTIGKTDDHGRWFEWRLPDGL